MRKRRFAALLACALATVACNEQPYRQYPTVAAAVAAGERERGWLAGWVPANARELHLQGDLDTHAWWLRFELPAAAADSLRQVLEPATAVSPPNVRPRRAQGWWIQGRIEQQPATDAAPCLEVFHGTGAPVGTGTFVAFECTSPRVFAWSTAGQRK